MSIFDTYQKGSFRNVPFLYVDSDGDLGRRTSVFEYPGRDLPYVEDMGRKARTWSLEILVAGSDYMKKRDDLIKAIESPGPGLLIHPTFGQITVVVRDARGPKESTQYGGTARFSITFIEAGANTYPAAKADTRVAVSEKAAAAHKAAAEQLDDALSTDGPGFIFSDAVAQVSAFASGVRKAIAKVSDLVQNSDIMKAVNDLSADASDLIRSPMDLYLEVQEIVGDIVTAVTNPLDAFNALRDFFDFSGTGDDIPLTTESRRIQAENREQLVFAVTTAVSIAATQAASSADYTSQAEADTLSATITAQLDVLCFTASAPLYEALVDLRAAIIQDLGSRPGLPGLITVTLPEDTPALVLAYRLYTDAGRADDIVSRNSIAHPGFVPGGLELEVLDV